MRYVAGLMMVIGPLLGLGLIAGGVRGLWTTWRQRALLRKANGIIVGVRRDRVNGDEGEDLVWTYRPVLRFTTEGGEVREFVSETGRVGNASPYRQGDWLPVLYDPDGLLSPRIDSWFALWAVHLILVAVVGPLFIAGGALVYVAFGQRILHGG